MIDFYHIFSGLARSGWGLNQICKWQGAKLVVRHVNQVWVCGTSSRVPPGQEKIRWFFSVSGTFWGDFLGCSQAVIVPTPARSIPSWAPFRSLGRITVAFLAAECCWWNESVHEKQTTRQAQCSVFSSICSNLFPLEWVKLFLEPIGIVVNANHKNIVTPWVVNLDPCIVFVHTAQELVKNPKAWGPGSLKFLFLNAGKFPPQWVEGPSNS